jgi:hypothetical protein
LIVENQHYKEQIVSMLEAVNQQKSEKEELQKVEVLIFYC